MGFMQRDVTGKAKWYEVETSVGTEFVPAHTCNANLDALREYCEGEPQSFETITGYGARLSAPGYMDCTEWTVFDTEAKAEEYLTEMYPNDEEDSEAAQA